MLPSDDELVQRDNNWLKLFERFSVDKSPEIDFTNFDAALIGEKCENGDDANDDDYDDDDDKEFVVDEVNNSDDEQCDNDSKTLDALKKLIQERVSAWPKKGINLVLKTIDPRVTVDEWLQMNDKSTTTTTQYENTVIEENNKKIFKTTKTITTTTKECYKTYTNRHPLIGDIKSFIDKPAIELPGKKVENVLPTQQKQKKETKSKKNTRHLQQINNGNPPYCLRKKLAAVIPEIESKVVERNDKPKKVTIRKSTRTKNNRSAARSKIKKSNVNVEQQIIDQQTIKSNFANTRVKLKRIKLSDLGVLNKSFVNTSKLTSKPLDKDVSISQGRLLRSGRNTSFNPINIFESKNEITNNEDKLAFSHSQRNQSLQLNESKLKQAIPNLIVIHTPQQLLGARINDAYMKVTKSDIAKHIGADVHCIDHNSILSDRIIPINCKIFYKPPTIYEENSEDDILLTSYRRVGNFWRIAQ